MSLKRSLPCQLHVLLSQHAVGLKCQLIDVSLDSLIGTIAPVGVAGNMAGEDVIAKEITQVNISSSNSKMLKSRVDISTGLYLSLYLADGTGLLSSSTGLGFFL